MPENECPTRTVGPSCRASTRWAEATASGSVVRGFCTAVALSPAACNRAITSDQDDASANSPCTRTTLRAVGAGWAAAALPWKRVLAAPAATMLTKVRRSIGYLSRRSSWLVMEVLLCVQLGLATGRVGVGARSGGQIFEPGPHIDAVLANRLSRFAARLFDLAFIILILP